MKSIKLTTHGDMISINNADSDGDVNIEVNSLHEVTSIWVNQSELKELIKYLNQQVTK